MVEIVEIVEIVETVNQQVPGRRRSSGLSFQKANLVRVGLGQGQRTVRGEFEVRTRARVRLSFQEAARRGVAG